MARSDELLAKVRALSKALLWASPSFAVGELASAVSELDELACTGRLPEAWSSPDPVVAFAYTEEPE